MPYIEKPVSEMVPPIAEVIRTAAAVLGASIAATPAPTTDQVLGWAKFALVGTCFDGIENHLKTAYMAGIQRAIDATEHDWGPRTDNALLDTAEWDAEMENAIATELAIIKAHIGDETWYAAATSVGIMTGDVSVEEVAENLAQHRAAQLRLTANPDPMKWLVSVGIGGAQVNAVVSLATNPNNIPAPSYPDMPPAPPPLPGTSAATRPSAQDEGAAFRAYGAAVEFDPGTVAEWIGVSASSLRNYMTGRTAPRKALTLAQAQRLHADTLNRIASLQLAAEIFASVIG